MFFLAWDAKPSKVSLGRKNMERIVGKSVLQKSRIIFFGGAY